jgi:hypothetical protein
MTDQEFKELIEKLHKLGLDGGDLGYEYWSGIINKLKEMRKSALQSEQRRKTN